MIAAADIARALGGQRLPDGAFLVPCPVPSHGKGRGDRNPSLQISDGERRVLVHCFGGCDARDVIDALRRRNLLGGESRTHGRRTGQRASRPVDYGREQHRKAGWLWQQREPISGSIAEMYLRGRRGYTGTIPPTLAFLAPRKAEQHPAMIACFAMCDEPEPGVLAPPPYIESVHLTLLLPDGSGKAKVKPNKIIVGSPAGRPLMLAPPNDLLGLAITEGIEDALTVHAATGLGAWAAGAAGFMPSLLKVPDYIEAVTIYAHADQAGQAGAVKLAEKLRARRIETRMEGLI